MPFTEQQILDAIRDPNYVNDRASGKPFGIPFGAADVPSMNAAEFSYMGLLPAKNVILEVSSFSIQSFTGEVVPNVFLTVAEYEAIKKVRNFLDPARACVMLDDPAGQRYCASVGESGRLSSASNPTWNKFYYGNQNRQWRFRDSVVLFGPSKPVMLVAVCVDVNLRFVATFQGREWPLDPANYNP